MEIVCVCVWVRVRSRYNRPRERKECVAHSRTPTRERLEPNASAYAERAAPGKRRVRRPFLILG